MTFEQGLARTIDWYLANDWWWRPIQDGTAGGRLGQREPCPVTGGNGQLGRSISDLVRDDRFAHLDVTVVGRKQLDICDARPFQRHECILPSTVINAAAFTDVDAAEQRCEDAMATNATGVARLANACTKLGLD